MALVPGTETGAGKLIQSDLAVAGSRRSGRCRRYGLCMDCGLVEYVNPR